MANIKVSEMTQADSVNDIDLLMIVQGSTNKKVTKQTLMKNINTEITNIKSEQATQNTKIQANTTAIETKASQSDLDAVEADIQTNRANITALQTENNNLRKALPNIKGTGTDITLNNTSENKFNELVVKGNTEQTQLSGKNLFDNRIVISGTSYNSENDLFTFHRDSGTDFLITINKLNLKLNTNYMLYMNITENTMSAQMSLVSSSTSFLEGTFVITAGETGVKSAQISTKSSTEGLLYDLWFYCANASGNLKAQIMLVEGTTAGNYEPFVGGIPSPNPDYPQNIRNVTGDVNVKISNKNIFDIDNLDFANGYYDSKGNFIPNNNNGFFDYIKVKPDTNYAFSFNSNVYNISIVEFDSSKVFLKRNNVSNTNKEIITTTNATSYLRIGTNLTNSSTVTKQAVKALNPQLEVNSSETDYVPHQEQNLPFTLGNIELNKIDTAQDYFAYKNNKWYKHEEIGKTILNGSESWNEISVGYYITPTNMKYRAKALMSHFTYSTNGIGTIQDNEFTTISGDGYSLWIKKIKSSISNLKTWLSNNNVYLKYQLATPTETEITNTTLINQLNAIKEAISYYEQTNISSTSNEISAIIEANAVGDLNLIIS